MPTPSHALLESLNADNPIAEPHEAWQANDSRPFNPVIGSTSLPQAMLQAAPIPTAAAYNAPMSMLLPGQVSRVWKDENVAELMPVSRNLKRTS